MFDLIFDNNRTFDWQISLSKIILSDDSLEQHMQIIKLKFKDNGCALKLMEKMSNIFERSGDNPTPPQKGY